MGALMRFYLGGGFLPEQPELVRAADDGSYYLSMMAAWYFATALFKREQAVLPYFTGDLLRPETKKRAIRKALESRRIRDEIKILLKAENTHEQLS